MCGGSIKDGPLTLFVSMEFGCPVNLMSMEVGGRRVPKLSNCKSNVGGRRSPSYIAQLVRDVNVRVIKESEFDFLLKETVGV